MPDSPLLVYLKAEKFPEHLSGYFIFFIYINDDKTRRKPVCLDRNRANTRAHSRSATAAHGCYNHLRLCSRPYQPTLKHFKPLLTSCFHGKNGCTWYVQ